MLTHLARFHLVPLCFTLSILPTGLLQAQDAAPQGEEGVLRKPAKQAKPSSRDATPIARMEGYDVKTSPANIAPTVATRTETVEVFGQPRMTKGHPNTYWDQEDIDYYRELLKTNEELQAQFAKIKKAMDKRIAEPIKIPPPQKGADGKWLFPGEYFPARPEKANDSPQSRFSANFSRDAGAVSDLGTLYALTGEAKYAEYARKLLLTYAVCSKWGISPRYNMRGEKGISGSLLGEAHNMMNWARGYDLIYNLPSWTKEDRVQLHDEFFYPIALSSLYPGTLDHPEEPWFACHRHNRGLFGNVSVLLAGLVTDDQELVNASLYGIHPTIAKGDKVNMNQWPPAKPWVAATAENPSYGLLTRYFAPDCIRGGMWVEPSVGYAFYTLGSMVGAAEILWHHGIDLYSHNNAIFKNMFDFPLLLSYPDLSEPGLGGSHRDLLTNFNVSTHYEYAYRRYRDPRYLAIISNPKSPSGSLTISRSGRPPTSLFPDRDTKEITAPTLRPSANWPLVGPGVLRTLASDGKGLQQSLILMSGPSVSKSAPDKLHIDLFALNDILMPSPGVVYPYNQPILPRWYNTTLAQNTLTVDEKSQNSYYNKSAFIPHADQVVFAPASTLGLQRAWTDTVYAGVTMDRAVFMTTGYFADLFGVFSKEPHKYDLAWHIRGEASSTLKFKPLTFPEPVANGYNTLTDVRQALVPGVPWSMAFTRDAHLARLHAAGAPAAQVIVGDGGLFYDKVVRANSGSRDIPTAPTILERRDKTSSTLYGNALDYSDSKEGYVKGVSQEGGLKAGYGLLKVETTKGTDVCFAAYRPGMYKVGGLETDAMQALVVMDGQTVQAMYLGGGKTLKCAGGALERGEPGLAYVERLQNGNYIVGNSSPTAATVTVHVPALAGMKAFHVNAMGQRGEAAGAAKADGSFSVALQANATVQLISSP